MRTVMVSLAFLCLAARVEAAELEAVSHPDTVIVFPSGAEVSRIANVKLDKGEHTIVLRDLPAAAVESSIRVEGKATGKLEIGSVDSRRMFVPQADAAAAESERRKIEEELERTRDERAALEAQTLASETQKSLIANLATLPTRPAPAAGAERGEDWPAVLALIASGTVEAQRLNVEAQAKLREVGRRIEDLEKKLGSLAPAAVERTEVKVNVAADAPLDADMTVRYQVPHASWTPHYDARLATGAKTVAPKLDLTRRATITQRTGESWDNVAITLSTTRPTAGAAAPELATMTVDFEPEYKPRPMSSAPAAGTGRMAAEQEAAAPAPAEPARDEDALGGLVEKSRAISEERGAEIVTAPFQALYAVPGRLTVPNTGEAKRVTLLSEAIEPQLSVRTVPREDAKAYLYAKLVLPKGSPLLPGAVSLFRDGTFVGTTRLPILTPGEEHDLGFGADDLVRVKYSVAEEKRGETGLISTSRTDSRNYKISVKNMHERAIGFTALDRIPVSRNDQIKVELSARPAPTKQDVDDKRGVLAWEGTLEPDQEQVIDFGYRVSWPSAKNVVYGP
jgi:uncharacterized protein (TIGR02231 family)